MTAYHVGVSIVNYRTAALVEECLLSLLQMKNKLSTLSVCVVDNASPDDSAKRLKAYIDQPEYTDWVIFIEAPENGGFSYGNNVAAKHFSDKKIDYFWLLNPDAAPRDSALDALIGVLDDMPQCAIVGSRLEDPDGTQQVASFNYPSIRGEFVNTLKLNWLSRRCQSLVTAPPSPENTQQVDWVAGASMLIRWAVLESVGFMDEGYFLYFEEVDLCLAVKKQGFSTVYVPASRVGHHVGAATGISDTRKQAPRRPAYWFESRRRFFHKSFGLAGAIAADILWIAGYSLFAIKSFLQRKDTLAPPQFLRDFVAKSAIFHWNLTK